ncbi:Oidioi.mRNA.OKI2018_I69.XSR.g15588.t1.cds [Oikopleura dioica]|uniref:Oidioi.mRNA.OKI2018_I69.XSR.g15588.t1.cds n=1 Tax=Oikopleura dioica TaxID=34765 RepID=A0ABN7SDB3_OIKDI|nr:Oidioi.mRNA.OKI2018_I69.XSR.g15588.t1.cds [Oikopleura dioica]
MADKYAEMEHKEYAKLVMAPGEQTWSQKILNFAKGTTFSAVLVLTGISGFTYAFYVCAVLLLLSPKLLFFFFNFVQVTWNQIVVLGLRCLHNCSYKHYGETFRPKDKKILILANHRTRMDWLIILNFLYNHGKVGGLRFSLKAPLRFVPGVGWFLSLACHVFLKRRFEDDREHILDCLELYSKTMDNVSFYFFPEGTVYWPDMIRKSNSFAKKAGVEPLSHLLLPRTTGFKFLMENEDNFFDAIYDITTSYEQHIPQHEPALFTGCMPPVTNVVLKRYEIASAKKDPERFLEKIWREKDKMLDEHFADKTYYDNQQILQPYSTSVFENAAKCFGVLFWCWRTFVHLTNFWAFLPFLTIAIVTTIFVQQKFFSLSYCLTRILKAQRFLRWKKIQ